MALVPSRTMSRRGTAGWYGMISRKMLLSQRNHKCSSNSGSGSGGLLAPITNGTAGIIMAMASDARKKCGTALTFASYYAGSASSSKTASRRQQKILPRKGESPKKPRHQRPLSGIWSPTSSCTTSADLTQPNAMSTTMKSGALDDPHQLSNFPFETVRQRNVSTKRPPAWGSYSRASSKYIDSNESEWALDENGDVPNTPILLGRTRKYPIMSTQGLDGTYTCCHSAPTSTPLACNKAPTRAVIDGT